MTNERCWVLIAVLAACGNVAPEDPGPSNPDATPTDPLSCATGPCVDPGHPFCDVDGAIGGAPNQCIAVTCTPQTFSGCRGDDALTCNASGDSFDVARCEFGCSTSVSGCKLGPHIIPKYLPAVCDQLAPLPALVVDTTRTLDTRVDGNCNGGIVAQTNGPEICVVRHAAITIDANRTLNVIGPRALALVADQAVAINGVLDVSANGAGDGPGGGRVISPGTSTGSSNTTDPSGGGGAGFKTTGGAGGAAGAGGAVNGGPIASNPGSLAELVGGIRTSEGGEFGGDIGGGAGGAATLISCRGTVSVAGIVDAGGGGGGQGYESFFVFTAPSGGGSGGNVAFQGMSVAITGQLYANGGGGGAGRPGTRGSDGLRSTTQSAPGGTGSGVGGTGGRLGAAPGTGEGRDAQHGPPGAGGGSVGFWKAYAPDGATVTLTPSAASPGLDPTGTIPKTN